jgi:hypothetical protein
MIIIRSRWLVFFLVYVATCEFSSAQVAMKTGQNFTGTIYGVDSPAQPADANGAVGPAHFVEFVNGHFAIYNRVTALRVLSMGDREFWIAAGLEIPGDSDVTDPRIFFDWSSRRWFTTCVDVPADPKEANRLLIAISSEEDPTAPWNGTAIQVDPAGENFGDFPTLGMSSTFLLIGADMFDASGNNVGGSLNAIPKKSLLQTPPTAEGRQYFGELGFSYGDVLQPAFSLNEHDESAPVLAVSDVGFDGDPHNTLIGSSLVDLSGVVAISPPQSIGVPPYVLTEFPPQPDGSRDLDNGDCRFSATVQRVGDVMFAVQSTQVGTRGGIQWFKINATNYNVIDTGVISDDRLDLYYPSIAANQDGTVVIACNGSSPEVFISSYATVADGSSGALKFGSLQLLKSGTASYHDKGGFGDSRWGDYSATTLDPTDPNRFWTIQLYAYSTNAWATQITELITTSIRLRANSAEASIVLSWPEEGANFKLQHSANLAQGGSWTIVNQVPTVQNGRYVVLIPTDDGEGYFRLIAP